MGTLRLVNGLDVRASDSNVWNQHEVARICDQKASSHRKDIERTPNDTAEPWTGQIESRCGTNDAYRTIRTVCISKDQCRKTHSRQWHA